MNEHLSQKSVEFQEMLASENSWHGIVTLYLKAVIMLSLLTLIQLGYLTPCFYWRGGVNFTPFPSDLGRWSGDRREILPEHRAGCTLQEYMVKVFKTFDFLCLMNYAN